ncbi:hypothetical protein MP228_003492 [Amoeboaphelidium protococcarum]|nr:hypothetical protein MP228_003492 [Amoeboaphelidium protococcarum]
MNLDVDRDMSETYVASVVPIKFKNLDWDRVSEITDKSRFKASSIFWYTTMILGKTMIEIGFFAFEVLVLLFLFPKYGIGDSQFGNMDQDYTIPGGAMRYLVIFCLSMILILKVGMDFIGEGLLARRQLSIGDIMANPNAYKITALSSIHKFILMHFLSKESTVSEKLLGWLIYACNGWIRFLMVKTPLCIMYAVTTYYGATMAYRPIISYQVQTAAIVYMSLRFAAYCIELFNKTMAAILYVVLVSRGGLKRGIPLNSLYAKSMNKKVKKLTKDYTMGDFAITQQTVMQPLNSYNSRDDQYSNISNSNKTVVSKEEFDNLELESPLLTPPKSAAETRHRPPSPNRIRFDKAFSRPLKSNYSQNGTK